MHEVPVDIDEACAVLGFVDQMIVPDLVIQRGRFGHERQAPNSGLSGRRGVRAGKGGHAGQAARESSEVAEVANRPKNRPGRRQRSSITTRRQTKLVWFRAMLPSNTRAASVTINRWA